jgi:hypothetical protein
MSTIRLTARAWRALVALCLVAAPFARGSAQAVPATAPTTDRLRVFLDCRTFGCDREFLIEQLPFVALTQDRLDAEVHLLVTSLETGAGGTEFTFAFLGQQRFAGRADTISTALPPNSTDDARRREVARMMRLGLVPYALRTVRAGDLDLQVRERDGADGRPSGTAGLVDPWNFWIYRARLSGSGSAESRESDYEMEGSFSAERVTEASKINAYAEYEYEASNFTLSSGAERSFALRGARAEGYYLKSLTDHWSAGAGMEFSHSEFENRDLRAELNAAVEYSFYPYAEATRRQVVAVGIVGYHHLDHAEVTIYDRLKEQRPIAMFVLAGEIQQEWGELEGSLEHFQYLHDHTKYRLSLNANTDIRLTRGLSLSLSAFGSKVNDQLSLPRGDASDEDVLTRQRALATAYRFGGSIGISFTFGSIFNTVVNPRFGLVD